MPIIPPTITLVCCVYSHMQIYINLYRRVCMYRTSLFLDMESNINTIIQHYELYTIILHNMKFALIFLCLHFYIGNIGVHLCKHDIIL